MIIKPTKIIGLSLLLSALPLVVLTPGCAGDRYHRSTGESVDDHATSRRVRSALSDDPEYKFEGVQIQTFRGTVQLSGFVATSAQKSRAAKLAKDVPGVKDVENNITVK